jgi:alkanesulfonate monooxygenase
VPSDDGAPPRPPTTDYLTQVASAADVLGFDALLTPCGTGCEDAWISTAMLIARTRRVRFLVAFRPGLLSPTLAAQMASTYQRLSGGRLALNIVVGAEPAELARFGDFHDKASRYERAGEFMEVMRGAWDDEPFDFDGSHYRVERAHTRVAPNPAPDIYFGGASENAELVAARSADVYLTWGEPPEQVAESIADVKRRSAARGRTMRFGIRLHFIVRDTDEQAWAAANTLIAKVPDDVIAAAQAKFKVADSVGQRRMQALHGGDRNKLEISPNLWAGVGLVRSGSATALVGSPATVAARIKEYQVLGIETVIGSGYPHLEEAYRVAEGVFPLLNVAPSSTTERPQLKPSILGGRGMAILTPEDHARVQQGKQQAAG